MDDFWCSEVVSEASLKVLEKALADCLDAEAGKVKRELWLLDRRLAEVQAQRMDWAEKAVAGTVPDDLAKAKQTELAKQLASLTRDRKRLARVDGNHQRMLDQALGFLRDSPGIYLAATPALRRVYNQTYVKQISIDDIAGHPTVRQASYPEPVASLRRAARAVEGHSPGPGSCGVKCDLLDYSNQAMPAVRTSDRLDHSKTAHVGIRASQTQLKRPARMPAVPPLGPVSNNKLVGWMTGLEPAAAWTTTRSSTN